MTSFLRSLFDVMASSSSETLIIYSFIAFGIIILVVLLSAFFTQDNSLTSNYHLYAKSIALMASFLMVVYITLMIITYAKDSHMVEGTVKNYQYDKDMSKITLQVKDEDKQYDVVGIANTFRYHKGDDVQVSSGGNFIYNVKEINDHSIKSPLSKLHVIFILLILTTIGVTFDVILHAFINRSKRPGINTTFKEIWDIISVIVAIAVFIIMFVIIGGRSTDNRVVHVDGKITEHIDDNHYVVKDNQSSIHYIINDDKKRQGSINAEINQVSHKIVEINDKK